MPTQAQLTKEWSLVYHISILMELAVSNLCLVIGLWRVDKSCIFSQVEQFRATRSRSRPVSAMDVMVCVEVLSTNNMIKVGPRGTHRDRESADLVPHCDNEKQEGGDARLFIRQGLAV